jgi:hypothetical protein
MVWEGKEVIKTGRGLIGATNPLASAPGTIRGDFGVDMGRNIIHGSGNPTPTTCGHSLVIGWPRTRSCVALRTSSFYGWIARRMG